MIRLLRRFLGPKIEEWPATAPKVEVLGQVAEVFFSSQQLPTKTFYSWHSEERRQQASLHAQELTLAVELHLSDQAALSSSEIVYVAFLDFSEAVGLQQEETALRPITDNLDTGFFRLGTNIVDTYLMYPVNNNVVRLPLEALRVLKVFRGFPQRFVQKVGILKLVAPHSPYVKDLRFTGERLSNAVFPQPLHLPDPILVARIANRCFKLYQWE